MEDQSPAATPEPPPPASAPQRNGCLTAFLVLVGAILLLPGLCTMAFSRGGISDPIALIALLVALGGFALIALALLRTGR